MRTVQRQKIITAGDYVDIEIYPVSQKSRRGIKRAPKQKPSRKEQIKLNLQNARKKLFYLIHANFGASDRHLTLTYDDGYCPETPEQAKRDFENYIDRLRRVFKKANATLKYVAIIESGETGRLHHHVIISGAVGADALIDLWGHGYANADRLQMRKDHLMGLVNYVTKDAAGKKRWSCSRGLMRPWTTPEIKDNAVSKKTVKSMVQNFDDADYFKKLFPGYDYVFCVAKKNEYIRGDYVYLRLHKIAQKTGAKNEKRFY